MATPIPENTATFTLAELAAAVGSELPGGANADTVVVGVTTDSRGSVSGKLFVALRGERFDGHAHVRAAAEAGARAALVETATGAGVVELVVPSTLEALGALAGAHRNRVSTRLIALAGAAGKTTTRAITEALLRDVLGGGVHATSGNLNNRIGVPMVLLGLREEHQVAVVEIGTNQPGEVAALTRVVRPDVALLTLIDLEHTEGLCDLDGVEKEEGAVFSTHPAVAIGNGDDPRVHRQLERAPAKRRLSYGFGPGCEYRVLSVTTAQGERIVECQRPSGRFSLCLPWLPRTSLLASLGALAAAEGALGEPVPVAAIQRVMGSGSWQQPGRFALRPLPDGTLVVDDSYNSNPASLRAALLGTRELAEARGSAFHLVLGEMRELGPLSQQEHRNIGRELETLGARSVTAITGDARFFVAPDAGENAPASGFFANVDAATPHVLKTVRPGDVVLVKGSRGVESERIVTALSTSRRAEAPR